jgi:hypothetical protein
MNDDDNEEMTEVLKIKGVILFNVKPARDKIYDCL